MKKIAVIGATGWVGRSMMTLFPDAYPYTSTIGTKEEVNKCDVAFICVPTPNLNIGYNNALKHLKENTGEGKLNTNAIDEILHWIACPLVVIRSTVNPGDCDHWTLKHKKRIVMQPEYLGETPLHPMLNPKTRQFIVLGGNPEDRKEIIDLYATVYNANTIIRQVSAKEAEIIKLSENRAIAFKVTECQELYDACLYAKVDYYTIREAVYGDDPRFNLWWTFVYPDKRGFNSKCIPKDIYAWCSWAESLGYKPEITRAILEKNKQWIKNNV